MIIDSVDKLFDFLKENSKCKTSRVFRGVKSANYKLIPSIGRHKTSDNKLFTINNEIKTLKVFRQKAYPFLDKDYSDLDLLALAQHHGLSTRLLDWTWNPLVAFFFAVNEELTDRQTDPSQIYVWDKNIPGQLDPKFDPFKIKDTTLFLPSHLTKRIIAQSGIFTVHPDPNLEFDIEGIQKILITAKARKPIKKAIQQLGVHYSTMFPDLEGVAKYISWLRTDSY
jgi:hypothetical protein